MTNIADAGDWFTQIIDISCIVTKPTFSDGVKKMWASLRVGSRLSGSMLGIYRAQFIAIKAKIIKFKLNILKYYQVTQIVPYRPRIKLPNLYK